jgi:predicted phosphodiesterase
MKNYKVIVITDLHLPYESKRSLNTVEQYMGDHYWDELLILGDFMDFQYISKYNEQNARALSGKTIKKDYDYANEVLDRLISCVRNNNKKAKVTMLMGNHDYRMEAWIDKNPNLEGLTEFENGLRLKERGITYVESWSKGKVYTIGKASFIHGQYTGTHHAKKHVENFGKSIFYGHLHDVQCYPKVMKGDHKTIVGQSLGCLCDYNQSYMKGSPSNWQHAFGVFNFRPDGTYTYYVPQLHNHKFTTLEGVTYES